MDDDPWANAWGDAAATIPPAHTQPAAAPAWAFTTHENLPGDVQETDIGIPSWSTEAGVRWNESPAADNSYWAQPTTASSGLWDLSSHDHITSHSITTSNEPPSTSPPASKQENVEPPSIPQSPAGEPGIHPRPLEEPSPLLSPSGGASNDVSLASELTPSERHPDSPDAFGTFEEAVTDTQWAVSHTSDLDAQDWGAAWGSETLPLPEKKIERPPDGWEAASRARDSQGHQLPPESLSSLLQQARDLAEEVWPTPELSDKEKTLDEQDLNLQGMDNVEGLADAAAKIIIQDLTLPPAVRFNKTTVAKKMAEAIRLSRHAPLTRLSPTALSMVPKGSTSWEAAVKAQPDVVQDDVPPGWRILEKKPEEPTPVSSDSAKNSKIAGLLSFLGRGTSTPSSDKKPETPAPVTATSTTPTLPAKSSTDNTKPIVPPVDQTATSVGPTPTPTPHTAPAVVIPPNIEKDPVPPLEVTPSEHPSAISRFLERFSRSKGAQPSGPPSHKGLDLSSNDLEFLSGMGPSATDSTYKPIIQVSGPSDMVQSPSTSLPTKLPAIPSSRMSRSQTPVDVSEGHIVQPTMINGRASQSDSRPENLKSQPTVHPDTLLFPTPSANVTPKISDPIADQPLIASFTTKLELGSSHRRTPPVPNATVPPPVSKFPQVMMSRSPASNSSPSTPLAFKLLPPPSSRSQTPLIPPPPSQPLVSSTPISRILAPSPQPNAPNSSSMHASNFHEFDEFSDFHAPLPPSTDFSMGDTSFSSVSSSRSLVSLPNQQKDAFDFDDFDDFVSSPIRTPSPPRPPAKPSVPTTKRLPAMPGPSSNVPTLQQKRKMSRATDHSRTLSLVETAATRPGRWPAPPSPLPQALPPPGGIASNPFSFDLLGEQPQPPQSDSAPTGLIVSVSSPAAVGQVDSKTLDGSSSLSRHPTLMPFRPTNLIPSSTPPLRPSSIKPTPPIPAPMRVTPSAAPPPAPKAIGGGGLSAQDLSFFEGF